MIESREHFGTANFSNTETKVNACIPGRMRFDQDSINVDDETTSIDILGGNSSTSTPKKSKSTGNENVITHGKIQILNTLESFKSTDKNELLSHIKMQTIQKTRKNSL